jgi:hypothetical protein
MPAPLVIYEDIKDRFETDHPAEVIRRLIADAEAEVNKRYGSWDAKEEEGNGGGVYYHLAGRAASITTVIETVGGTETTLDATDYALRMDGRILERKMTGTHGRTTWGDWVSLTYAPKDERASRIRVIEDLTRLAIQYNAVSSESVGDASTSSTFGQSHTYQDERNKILAGLRTSAFGPMA